MTLISYNEGYMQGCKDTTEKDKQKVRDAINKVRKIYDEGYKKDEPFDGMDFAIDLLKELKL